MKINHVEKETLPIRILAQHSLSVVADVVRDLFNGNLNHDTKISSWQLIFSQSRANGGFSHPEDFSQARWQWPKDTWFQDRLSQKLRDSEFAAQRLNN